MRAPSPSSLPSTTLVESIDTGAATPVDLAIGPLGELYYVDLVGGTVRRYVYTGSGNHQPVAALTATPTGGPVPLVATFDASGSTDADPADQGHLTFAWNFGDGTSAAASPTATVTHTYPATGRFTASVTVTDPQGSFSTQTVLMTPGETAPTPVIDTPSAGLTWQVGQTVSFTGHATDLQDPSIPTSALRWSLRMQHCASVGDCHTHFLQDWTGVAGGSFVAPEHEYPSYLELVLTARDSSGLSQSTVLRLNPATVTATFTTNPPGVPVSVGEFTGITPFTRTLIKGSKHTISTPDRYVVGESVYLWRGWTGGAPIVHTITASANLTDTATFGLAATANFALGGSATADSSCNSAEGPQNAVNGTVTGGVADRWCSAGATPWLRIDLGTRQEVLGVVVDHAGSGGEDPIMNTRDFAVELSLDGKAWSTLDTVTGNTMDVTVHQASAVARYVRLSIMKPNGNGTAEAHIYDIKVVGIRPKLPAGPRRAEPGGRQGRHGRLPVWS